MTADAHRVVVAGPGADQGFVLEVGHLDVPGAHFYGAIAGHAQEGMHGRQMGIIGAHVDQAEVGTGAYRDARYYACCR